MYVNSNLNGTVLMGGNADIKAYARSVPAGMHYVTTTAETVNVPSGYNYCAGYILKRNITSIMIVLFNGDNTAQCIYSTDTWLDWKTAVSKSDLTGKTGSFGWTLDLCTVINKLIIERAGRITIVLYGIRTSPIGAANTEIELGTISGVTMPPFPIRVNAATGTEVYYCVNNAYAALSPAGKINLRLQNSTDRAFIINFEYAV